MFDNLRSLVAQGLVTVGIVQALFCVFYDIVELVVAEGRLSSLGVLNLFTLVVSLIVLAIASIACFTQVLSDE